MRHESETKIEDQSRELQNLMFGFALMNENTELYYKVYPPENEFPDEEDIDWSIPESPEDLQAMMREFGL